MVFMGLEDKIKKIIINSLGLEEITIEDIDNSEPLFGEGLGLDSIDALELGMALKKHFNLKLSSNKEENKKHFYSVETLAELIRRQLNE